MRRRPRRQGCGLGIVALAVAALALASPPPGANAAPAAQPIAETTAARAERGRRLLAQYQCGSCHRIPGVAGADGGERHAGQGAGTLEHFGRRSYIAGRLANQPALLQQWIADPQSLVPGTLMPRMGVSADEARDMAAYLAGLR